MKALVKGAFKFGLSPRLKQNGPPALDWWPEPHLQQGLDAHSVLCNSVSTAAQGLFSVAPSALAPENVSLRASSSRLEANAKTDFDLPVASWFFLS